MALELKQSMKLSQQLVITPQLQQAIKLLQLSRLELTDMVQNELLENPMLEEGTQAEEDEVPAELAKELEVEAAPDKTHEETVEVGTKDGMLNEPKEFDWENYLGTYNDPGTEMKQAASFEDLPTYENTIVKASSLQEHLEWQLHMCELMEDEESMGSEIIGSFDENGYLTISLEEIAEKNNFNLEDLGEILKMIQEFDPIGVGARNLQECLLLQAKPFKAERSHLEILIKEHLSLLEKKDYPSIARKMKLPLPKVLALAKIIGAMEPKPGRPYGGNDTQYVTPDVYIYKVGDDYTVVLNEEGMPRLRVSAFYRNMMLNKESGGGKAKDYVQDKLKSALWLIKSIHQRQRTLYRVSKCIVKFQRDFFDKGVDHLKPMILKDVAEEIGMHESTVSRATSNKYMHTPQGLYELKYFFNSGIASVSGQDVAAESVKERIRAIVAKENLKRPFSDKDIVNMLKDGNIDIARRTVAKYREMLGILPSSKRKQMY